MPGSQLGYLDSKERSLIIVVSGCRIMKNIQNYTHDIFFSQTYSVSSVICVNIHSVASANFDFTFDFSLFLHLCPNKSLSFIYTPSKLKKKKKRKSCSFCIATTSSQTTILSHWIITVISLATSLFVISNP